MDEAISSAHSDRRNKTAKKRGRPKKSTPEKRETHRLRQQKYRAEKSARLDALQKRYAIAFDLDPNAPEVETLRKEIKELRQQVKTSASHFTTPETVRFLGFRTPTTDPSSPLPSSHAESTSVPINVRD